ncbi:MAG TPA: hypothetical protein VM053_05885, partial [Gemmatimonadaceae bacterium]|nr:hypothetical protein [Gemmatimonadaceae bacterium]
ITSFGVTFHGHVAASWEIVARWSATVTTTERDDVERFGPTENARSAGPWRVVGALMVSQSDSALAVHSHSLAVATLIVPEPPTDVMVDVLSLNVTEHRWAEGSIGDSTVVDDEPQRVANTTAISSTIGRERNRTPPEWAMNVRADRGRLHATDLFGNGAQSYRAAVYV